MKWIINFADPYKVRTKCKQQFVRLNGQIMEEVNV